MTDIIIFWFLIFLILYIGSRNIKNIPNKKITGSTFKKPNKRKEIKNILKDHLSKKEKAHLLQKFDNKCFNCDSKKHLEFDHHIPLSKGYSYHQMGSPSNVVVLCKKCNKQKADKLPSHWYKPPQLKKLKDLGIIDETNYSSRKKDILESLTIKKNIDIIEDAIKNNKLLIFDYIDEEHIFPSKRRVEEYPISIFSKKIFTPCCSYWRWYLVSSSGATYNIKTIVFLLNKIKYK